uniref:Uncharacterized protein n=1 Tax=Mycobacterium riyadhense TaxID=486698 RepID=A0A653EWD4_9MYCO|nr:hypothetical protein BIN_B_03954 [Mycobacterium riyadhense]
MGSAVTEGELGFGADVADARHDVDDAIGGVVGVQQGDAAGVLVLGAVDQGPGCGVG